MPLLTRSRKGVSTYGEKQATGFVAATAFKVFKTVFFVSFLY